MQLPICVEKALSRINQSGYDAYVVGGCVRDILRGVTPADWDICTAASPQTIQNLFEDVPCILTGLQHGTVTVVMDGSPLEITTYRTEGSYTDSRHPDQVFFGCSLTEDLSRRDFTINSMAYHPQQGLVDPFEGREDLKKGILRCVGKAEQRFREDPLRILRGLRFASCFGFSFEEETAKALKKERNGLTKVSGERVREELNRLLLGKNVLQVLLNFSSTFVTIMPELSPTIGFEQHNRYHCYTVYEHLARAVASSENHLTVRLALLLHDVGKPSCFTQDEQNNGHFYAHAKISEQYAEIILNRLRYDRKTIERVCQLIHYHDATIEVEERNVKRWLNRLGEDCFRELLMVKKGDACALNESVISERLQAIEQLSLLSERVIREAQCFTLKDLAVNGKDLLAMGIPSGKYMGELLKTLLEKVIDGEIANERDVLLEYARENT